MASCSKEPVQKFPCENLLTKYILEVDYNANEIREIKPPEHRRLQTIHKITKYDEYTVHWETMSEDWISFWYLNRLNGEIKMKKTVLEEYELMAIPRCSFPLKP